MAGGYLKFGASALAESANKVGLSSDKIPSGFLRSGDDNLMTEEER